MKIHCSKHALINKNVSVTLLPAKDNSPYTNEGYNQTDLIQTRDGLQQG